MLPDSTWVYIGATPPGDPSYPSPVDAMTDRVFYMRIGDGKVCYRMAYVEPHNSVLSSIHDWGEGFGCDFQGVPDGTSHPATEF